ncbi:hypothetical protein H2200_012229 [Cladophialophora chaetospira]|uniref:Transcription factor domain-containing protein n=1 Tax=Cladophialophora chaetospira TaxID=386627 RepID=A0AA38WYI8_9EURO|nr:hypothetical protein H2200_012229 [Cladophialophora chaetospira]
MPVRQNSLQKHEDPTIPVTAITDVATREQEQMNSGGLFSNADSVPQDEVALGFDDLFYCDPFVSPFEDHSLQPLPQVTDGFHADVSTVYDFMSLEYDSTWAEYLPPRGPTPGILSDHFPGSLPQAEAGQANFSSRQDTGPGQQKEMTTAYAFAKLNEYATDQPSRPSSPSSAQAYEQFIRNLGQDSPIECDRLILDVFIGLFQVHVAPTFPCFKDFRANSSTPEELYLAMAATGGLYCQLPRSEVVANWLLHKARRKLMTLVHSGAPCDLATAQTYVLMHAFAVLSGDKRILLLDEVYISQTVQTLENFIGDQAGIPSVSAETTLLKHAMLLLQCYRVLILQEPTVMSGAAILRGARLTGVDRGMSSTSVDEDVPALVLCITSSTLSDIRIESSEASTQSLCALSIIASHLRRLPGPTARLFKSRPSHAKAVPRDWRQEFMEVSLQKWLTLHSRPPTVGNMLLYHLSHLNLYCYFAEMERIACMAKQMVERHPVSTHISDQTSLTASSFARWRVDALQKCFTPTKDIDKAAWHAHRIHEIATDVEIFSRSSGEPVHLRHEVSASSSKEPLHYSFTVYYASMVIWSSRFLGNDDEEKDSASAADTALRKGVILVSRSASQVARLFKRRLESLQAL